MATASRALHDDPRQSEKTRKHVKAIAKQLGYVMNPLLSQSLAHVRRERHQSFHGNVGFLQLRKGNQNINWINEAYEGAARRLEKYGFSLEKIAVPFDKFSKERVTEILEARGILGVIVGPVGIIETPVVLDWDRFAWAIVGVSLPDSSLHRSSSSPAESLVSLLAKLNQDGKKRIGFVSKFEIESRISLRLAAYWEYYHTTPDEHKIPRLCRCGLEETH